MSLTVCLLTPLRPGGVAVIRLAGDAAIDAVRSVCRRRNTNDAPALTSNHLSYARLFDGDDLLDDVVLALDERDRIEICLHGGVRVVQRALMLFEHCGATRIEPEELAEPTDAHDVVAAIDTALPRATTRTVARWLLAQRAILPPFIERLAGRASPPVTNAEQAAFDAASRAAVRAMNGLRIALVGPPNAGKSTLANALIGRERVITSDIPGTTRDWVEETALIAGWPITLTDTAGARQTDDLLEAEAIRRGLHRAGSADLVIVVLDATRPNALSLEGPSCRAVTVLNKIDLETSPAACGLLISAITGAGMIELERAIAVALELDLLNAEQPASLLSDERFGPPTEGREVRIPS